MPRERRFGPDRFADRRENPEFSAKFDSIEIFQRISTVTIEKSEDPFVDTQEKAFRKWAVEVGASPGRYIAFNDNHPVIDGAMYFDWDGKEVRLA